MRPNLEFALLHECAPHQHLFVSPLSKICACSKKTKNTKPRKKKSIHSTFTGCTFGQTDMRDLALRDERACITINTSRSLPCEICTCLKKKEEEAVINIKETHRVRAAEFTGCAFGQTNILDLALLNESLHGGHHFFNAVVGILEPPLFPPSPPPLMRAAHEIFVNDNNGYA